MRRQFSYLLMAAALLTACVKDPYVPEPVDGRSLDLSSQEITLEGQASAFSVQVTANFTYTVDIRADWIHPDPAHASTVQACYFVADENPSPTPREGEIRFADQGDRYYYKTVKVIQAADESARKTLYIVDKDATPETKALLANLWTVAETGWMFGHHDDLWYGRYWYNKAGESDTKAVCGDYPAVFSVDFAEMMDNRYSSSSSNAIRRRVILEARERGEVIMACAHLNNPLTGGDSWDNSSQEVVRQILTEGSATRTKYLTWLDRCADFANGLTYARGNLIPVIFRIYHEHTQGWSWWGSSCTTESDFIALWRFTVQYLRDTKGVHNFLYALSPQMDEVYSNPRNRILYRWPGDEWVDFVGMDCYHGTWDQAFISNLQALEKVSQDKKKPCGVTETGKESFTETDFWTRHILSPLEGRRVSLVTMWRNKYVGSDESDKHYFSVYPGHPSEADFRTMYEDPRSLFSRDLPDMYTLPSGYEIK